MRSLIAVAALALLASPAAAQTVTTGSLPPVQTTAPSSGMQETVVTGLDAMTTAEVRTQQTTSAVQGSTYRSEEILEAAKDFFGETSTGLAQAVQRVFAEQGEPTGYIRGEEFAGAFGAGVRYGKGTLYMRNGEQRQIFWQGPSVGFDTGANASKVFTLVYDLGNPGGIYRRYPGVEGAAFFVAGVSVTYQRAEGVTLAPIRTGVGLRLGANAGYTSYSMKRRWLPF